MFRLSLVLLQRRFLLFNTADMRRTLNTHSHSMNSIYHSVKLFEKLDSLSQNCRNYAKSRNIKKDKQKNIKVYEDELQEYFDVEKLFADMHNPLDHFKEELCQHAILRSSPNAIENLKVKFEGNTFRIQDLAKVGKKNPTLYILDFSSFPSAISVVLSTLQTSEFNINAQQEGTKLFIPVPKVTKEYREALAKKSKLYFVKCKEAIRDVQMKYTKNLANIDKLSSEKKFRLTQQLAALGDKEISLAEEILRKKQEELLKDQGS